MWRLPAKRRLLSHQRLDSVQMDRSTDMGKDNLPPLLGTQTTGGVRGSSLDNQGFISGKERGDAGGEEADLAKVLPDTNPYQSPRL